MADPVKRRVVVGMAVLMGLLAVGGCELADSPVATQEREAGGGTETADVVKAGQSLDPETRNGDPLVAAAVVRTRLAWSDRSLTLLPRSNDGKAADPAYLAVDRLQERALAYRYDPDLGSGEVRFQPAEDVSVCIIDVLDRTPEAVTPVVLVERPTGTVRYLWPEVPAVLLRQIREYCRPFAAWANDRPAADGLVTGDRNLGDWRPFINWYCGFTRKLYLLTNGFPTFEPTLALCDLVFTLMDWEYEDWLDW